MRSVGIAILLSIIVNTSALAEESATDPKADPVKKPGILGTVVKLPAKAWTFFANRLVDLYSVPVRNVGN